jgi:hypothetical protein
MITLQQIENLEVEEGQKIDFKMLLDLKNPDHKNSLINDTVAFLNAQGGEIIIGVKEGKTHQFESFHPIPSTTDQDEYGRTITSILLDSIDPKPKQIEVSFQIAESGLIPTISIGSQPGVLFQNRITGARLVRVGRQNTPITAEALASYLAKEEKFDADHAKLFADRKTELRSEPSLSGIKKPLLIISVLPREYYEENQPFLSALKTEGQQRKRATIEAFRSSWHTQCEFKTKSDGVLATDYEAPTAGGDREEPATTYFQIKNGGHGTIILANPVRNRSQGELYEFDLNIKNFISDINEIYEWFGFKGPYHLMVEIEHLDGRPPNKLHGRRKVYSIQEISDPLVQLVKRHLF